VHIPVIEEFTTGFATKMDIGEGALLFEAITRRVRDAEGAR
jgi:hypothetical protein